jgi:DNA-directed RNA polymerase specialized sigma24 family protein
VQISKTEYLNDALRGDPDSFRQLVESYQTAVFNLCYRMLGDTYEAEDAAQETFFRAYKSRHHCCPLQLIIASTSCDVGK